MDAIESVSQHVSPNPSRPSVRIDTGSPPPQRITSSPLHPSQGVNLNCRLSQNIANDSIPLSKETESVAPPSQQLTPSPIHHSEKKASTPMQARTNRKKLSLKRNAGSRGNTNGTYLLNDIFLRQYKIAG